MSSVWEYSEYPIGSSPMDILTLKLGKMKYAVIGWDKKISELDNKAIKSIEAQMGNINATTVKGNMAQSDMDLLLKLEQEKLQILKVSFGRLDSRAV